MISSPRLNRIKSEITSFQSSALKNGHRLPVVIFSSTVLLKDISNALLELTENKALVSRTSTLKANDIIGREYDLIIFFIHPEFDPNLFAAISGTLKTGGLFILLVAENDKHTPFSHYIVKTIRESQFFFQLYVNENNIESIAPLQTAPKATGEGSFSQQNHAINLIHNVATGHRNRPLTITADRGRGKSAAIGIAIGQLIAGGTKHILITAPSLAATAVIFKHIKQALPDAICHKGQVIHQQSLVSFIAPDKLLQTLPDTELLIVDEAAGLNLFMLETFLQRYSRIVFATTLHGYEGSGQGFITRFSGSLKRITPHWKNITLDPPIRWQKNDPLETFINQTFVLSPVEKPIEYKRPNIENINIRRLTQLDLVNDKSLRENIYRILKSAHYKTSPNDLRQLMTAKNAIVFCAYFENTLIAAAIVEKEGKLTSELTNNIYQGRRRPKGEFIPQSIINHLGLKEAADLHYLRIMRVAVQPELQGKKIGSFLLSKIITYAKNDKFDCIACSFGATNQLLNFWDNFDFHILRVGYKKNVFSGCNAILLAKPVSESANQLIAKTDDIFYDNFIAQLPNALSDLDSKLAYAIIKQTSKNKQPKTLKNRTLDDINSFCFHHRSYDDNLASIKQYLVTIISSEACLEKLTETQIKLIILKVFQNKSWKEICKRLNLSGKAQAMAALKSSLRLLVSLTDA